MELSRRIDGVEFYLDIYASIDACNQQSASRYSRAINWHATVRCLFNRYKRKEAVKLNRHRDNDNNNNETIVHFKRNGRKTRHPRVS